MVNEHSSMISAFTQYVFPSAFFGRSEKLYGRVFTEDEDDDDGLFESDDDNDSQMEEADDSVPKLSHRSVVRTRFAALKFFILGVRALDVTSATMSNCSMFAQSNTLCLEGAGKLDEVEIAKRPSSIASSICGLIGRLDKYSHETAPQHRVTVITPEG